MGDHVGIPGVVLENIKILFSYFSVVTLIKILFYILIIYSSLSVVIPRGCEQSTGITIESRITIYFRILGIKPILGLFWSFLSENVKNRQ